MIQARLDRVKEFAREVFHASFEERAAYPGRHQLGSTTVWSDLFGKQIRERRGSRLRLVVGNNLGSDHSIRKSVNFHRIGPAIKQVGLYRLLLTEAPTTEVT